MDGGCKGSCDNNRCTCKKAGLNCPVSCKESHGSTCNNNSKIDEDISDDELDDDIDERHFLDAFI